MARIHSLHIENFRGIKTFDQVFQMKPFICLIGRGDSGKTTILKAISCVLCPNWNISIYYCPLNHNSPITTPSLYGAGQYL